LENDNLVPCWGACTKQNRELYIVSELMSKGPLDEFIKAGKQFMDLQMILKFAADISKGMNWLHSLALVHRDLKSLNILVNNDFTCKIIDFGTSRVKDSDKNMTANVGTPAWMAPEVLLSSKYTEKADVYSFAIVMWEMITGEQPYASMKTWSIPQHVIEGNRPPIPKDINPDYAKVMRKCWDTKEENRPSFAELEKIFGLMINILNEDEKKTRP